MKKNKFQMKPKIKKDINHLLTLSLPKSMYSLPSIHKKFIQKYLHEKKTILGHKMILRLVPTHPSIFNTPHQAFYD